MLWSLESTSILRTAAGIVSKGLLPMPRISRASSSTLKVSSRNIRLMRDACRRDIIDAIAKLKEGKLLMKSGEAITIQPESAFIFFYTGHGGRTSIPETWKKADYVTTDGKVKQLIPSDIDAKDKFGGHEVVGIPDRLISAVLRSLIDKMGDNIVIKLMLQP